MNRRKGFTLVELVVALSVSTIFLGTISLSLFYISKMSSNLINNSSNLYKIASVRDYIVDNNIDATSNIVITEGDVIINNKKVVNDSLINNIRFEQDNNNFKVCIIEYKNEIYRFTIKG